MTDQPQFFDTSDLARPSSEVETWRKLGDQLSPSNGPGSASGTNHDAQWLRKISIAVYASSGGGTGNAAGEDFPGATSKEAKSSGIELSALRVNFNIKAATAQNPAILWARVYNMAPETMAKVIQFTRIQVKAGYHFSNYGMIFDGTIVEYKRGKENPVDTYLEISAGDGDLTMNRNVFIAQYAAETKDKQIIMDCAKQLGMNVKYIDPDIGKDSTLRDQTIIEPARQKLRELMQKYNAQFFVEHGELVMIKNSKGREGEAVVLTPRTGLTGLPEVTPQGIVCQCLLNPQIRPGTKIKISTDVLSGVPFLPGSQVKFNKDTNTIDNSSSSKGEEEGGAGGPRSPIATNAKLDTAFTSPVGIYKVVLLEHTGDTRGDPWFCNMTCIALDNKGNALFNPANAFNRLATPETIEGTGLPGPSGGGGAGSPKEVALAYRRVA